MRCLQKLLGLTYHDRIASEEVKNRIQSAIGPYTDLLTLVKQRKLNWFGHVTYSSGLDKIIRQGTVQGVGRRGGQRKSWHDNITEWTGLELRDTLRRAEHSEGWSSLERRISMVPPRATRLRDRYVKMVKAKVAQRGGLRPSGPPSGQGAGGGARIRDRRFPADLRVDSLATVPSRPLSIKEILFQKCKNSVRQARGELCFL
ncbi:retrovirus-related pol polyprotein line-1 [Plakobranchus ocellatus]|uniref:Retrovirus-related pol polyprotein line-1 n=1 Tax=Plakobranchus ocellatus TaxID=259542 RepID=A0AAV3X8P0_9GAST|nr:retrovirus-related pol polyprotein line-1 [Plakobranchus ocellatus]